VRLGSHEQVSETDRRDQDRGEEDVQRLTAATRVAANRCPQPVSWQAQVDRRQAESLTFLSPFRPDPISVS